MNNNTLLTALSFLIASISRNMALVNITNVMVMDNPTSYLNPFQFEITFECLQELQDGKTTQCCITTS